MNRRNVRVSLAADNGNAIVEFVFVAVGVLVPLIYLIVAVAAVQRTRLATTGAARDVGRAIATADSAAAADTRAQAALRIALANQAVRPSDVRLRYVEAGADCRTGASLVPSLAAGAQFQVCVIGRQRLPAVPSVLSGRGVVIVGRYLVHVDDFRTIR